LKDGVQETNDHSTWVQDILRPFKNGSPEAASAHQRLNSFMESIRTVTLETRTAADVINEGKQLVYGIVKSVK
jgi:hypothetical protein